MVTSVKKTDVGDKTEAAGRKIPFLDWYLVGGTEIRKLQESRKIRAKIMERLLSENISLRRHLARYES